MRLVFPCSMRGWKKTHCKSGYGAVVNSSTPREYLYSGTVIAVQCAGIVSLPSQPLILILLHTTCIKKAVERDGRKLVELYSQITESLVF